MNMHLFLSFVPLLILPFISVSQDSFEVEASLANHNHSVQLYPDTLITFLNRSNNYTRWEEIEITDQLFPKYLNTIHFCPQRRNVRILNSTRKNISRKKINKILKELIHEIHKSDSLCVIGNYNSDPLSQFGLDSNWYKSNILQIWQDYRERNSVELNQEQIIKSNAALLNYSRLKRMLLFPNNWNKDEQAMIDVRIKYASQTIHLQATSYFPYMLSWYYFNNQSRLANYKISLIIGELLLKSKVKSKNLDRILGTNIESALMDDLYKRYLLREIL